MMMMTTTMKVSIAKIISRDINGCRVHLILESTCGVAG